MIIGAGQKKLQKEYPLNVEGRVKYNPKSRVSKNNEFIYLLGIKELNLTELLTQKDYYISPKSKRYSLEKIVDHMKFAIHLVLSNYESYKVKNETTALRYFSIPANTFETITKYYKDIIDFLIHAGIIESENHYKPNVRSKGYRIAEEFLIKGIERVKCYDKYTIRKLKSPVFVEHPLEQFLNNNLSIKINEHELRQIQISSTNKYKQKIIKKKRIGYKDPRFKSMVDKYEISIKTILNVSVLQINNHWFKYKVDSKTGRHFSTLNNCKSELRNFIYYGKRKLCEVDVSSSVCFCLLAILNRKETSLEMVIRHDQLLKKDKLIRLIDDIPHTQLELFKNKVLSGIFYEFIGENLTRQMERSSIKEAFYCFLFDKIGNSSQVSDFFNEAFPEISFLLYYIKHNFKRTKKDGKTDYDKGNALAMALLNIESDLMINKVAKAYLVECPNQPIYSLHDGFFVPEDMVSSLKRIIRRESIHLIGHIPNLTDSLSNQITIDDKPVEERSINQYGEELLKCKPGRTNTRTAAF